MTRRIVYGAAFVAVIAATVMTIASVATPEWVTYTSRTKPGGAVHDKIGLHRRCMSINGRETCTHFPTEQKCDSDKVLCSMWRTTGFLMSLAIVAELATVVSFLIIMVGGKMKRERGWKLLGIMLGVVAVIEFSAMGVVTYLYDYDDMFLVPGYQLDTSWYLCTFSGAIAILCGLGLAISAYVLPPEDGYEFLHDSTGV